MGSLVGGATCRLLRDLRARYQPGAQRGARSLLPVIVPCPAVIEPPRVDMVTAWPARGAWRVGVEERQAVQRDTRSRAPLPARPTRSLNHATRRTRQQLVHEAAQAMQLPHRVQPPLEGARLQQWLVCRQAREGVWRVGAAARARRRAQLLLLLLLPLHALLLRAVTRASGVWSAVWGWRAGGSLLERS